MTTDRQPPTLIGGIEKRAIEIVEYDPTWPDKFAAHEKTVRNALGALALRIEHIGSTSVSGLGAKPIIDMLLVVRNSADEPSYLPQLVNAGYELRVREPEFHEHRMLRTAARDVHLHVFSQGSTEIDRYLIFRDRLRSNADDRKLYEATKRRLAAQPWPDMNAYADAKTEVVETILTAARAASTGSSTQRTLAVERTGTKCDDKALGCSRSARLNALDERHE